MMHYNARRATGVALLLTLAIPIYWLSQFGLFFERLLWPHESNPFYWRDVFTLVMHLLIITTLLNLRASLAHVNAHWLKKSIMGLVVAMVAFSVTWLVLSNLEFVAERAWIGVFAAAAQILLLVATVAFAAALFFTRVPLPSSLRLISLFLVLAIAVPLLTLGVMLGAAPIALAIASGLLALYFHQAQTAVDVV